LLAGGPAPADIRPLGVVTHAERAHVGTAAVSEGSAIYEGDRLSTEAAGNLRIASPSLTLQLDAQSTLVVQHPAGPEGGVLAEVASGILIFAAASTGKIVVAADDALIRPAARVPTIAYIRVVNRRELWVYAKRGALEFSYHGENETIADGARCRVLLDPSDTEAAVAIASESEQDKKKLTKHHKFLILALIVIVPGVAIPLLIHALESPDRPGPSQAATSKNP
jgi:hypothetical protein